MSGGEAVCTRCGATVAAADRFCEGCGTVLSGMHQVAVPKPAVDASAPCADCGQDMFVDDYCIACGSRRAEPDRDQAALEDIVLITDRGIEHPRNEDAAAAGIVVGASGEQCIAVAVCDGVSTSAAAHLAAVGASTAGVEAMLNALAVSSKSESAILAGLDAATRAAATAGEGTADAWMAPSCTYTAAIVVPTSPDAVEITVGNVGDSRVYWLPESPSTAQCLTVDDSVAQELITAGVAADSAAVLAGAHTLTRWLGADAGPSPWSDSSIRALTTTDRGILVVCSDGLWNYLPEAGDIARIAAGTDVTDKANALVEFALAAGGHDNITVAVIPIGGHP